MKSLSFVFLFYPVTIFCMHSTENRQELYEMQERDNVSRAMESLFNESFYEGDVSSAKAYTAFDKAAASNNDKVQTTEADVLKKLRDRDLLESNSRFYVEKLAIWKSHIQKHK